MVHLFQRRKPIHRLLSLALLGLLLVTGITSIRFAFAATPNLEVTVSDDVDTVAPNQLLTYRVTVRNTSATTTLFNVDLSNTLPPQVTYIRASDGGTYDAATRTITWNAHLTLDPGAEEYRYVTVRVATPLAVGTTIVDNVAAWTSSGRTPSSPSTGQDTDTVRNVAPIAQSTSYTTDEGMPLLLDLASLVMDHNGDTVTITITTPPSNGTLIDNGNDTYTYTASDAEFSGSDTFSYQAQDPHGSLSNDATVSITIRAVNDPPVAQPDTAANVYEDNQSSILASMLLANDTDIDGGTLTITSVGATSANNGTVTLSPDRSTITYQPASNFNGADTFTYTVSDGLGGTATGTVSITVDPVNDAPSFTSGGNQVVNEDAGPQSVPGWATAISAGPQDEQSQTLSFQITNNNSALFSTQPAIGSDGTLTYRPAANKSGIATVLVTLRDNGGIANGGVDRSTQTFTITVAPVNDPPVAYDDNAATQIKDSVSVTVLSNDFDPENDTLSLTGVTQPPVGMGSVTFSGNTATYMPPTSYAGTLPFSTSFTYTVSDGNGGTATGTVYVTVTKVNYPPQVVDHTYSMTEDQPGGLFIALPGVLEGASDQDGDELFAQVVTRPSRGRVDMGNKGSFTYVPTADYNGTDTFTYQAFDGTSTSNIATVTINIAPVNDPPSITNNGNVSVLEDSGSYSAAWLTGSKPGPSTASDEQNQTVSWTIENNNSGLFEAQPVLDSGGTLTFTPAADAYGVAAITVNVRDSAGATAQFGFTITVNAVNDAPSFTPGGNVTVAEDSGAYSAVWATGMTKGPANESNQVLTFVLNNDNPALFAVQPAVAEDGTLTFTPAANAAGTANVSVVMQDNGGTTNGGRDRAAASFIITVTNAGDAPSATADTVTTTRNRGLTIASATLLRNDIDPDGDVLTISAVSASSAAGGAVTRSGSDVVYTPAANFVGDDTFTYTVTDGQGNTATATVTVTVRDMFLTYVPLVVHGTPSGSGEPPATPDLVGSFSISPSKTTFGTSEDVMVTARVTNQGNAPAGPFWVDFYINPTSAPTTTNIAWNTVCSQHPCQGIAWYVKDGLAPGQSITLTSTASSYMSGYTIWSGQFGSGTTDLYLYVDSWNPNVATGGVAESSETNNRAEQHNLVVTGSSAQIVDQADGADLPPRPAHPSN